MNSLISELKSSDQDFEFYPTTNEIIHDLIRCLKSDQRRYNSILDIGAGNGKVLLAVKKQIEDIELYAIEKSPILRASLDPSIYVIGTDFMEQSLFDKNIENIFCNPPYSNFQEWAAKIIRESSGRIFLVIPERWRESVLIQDALKFRDAHAIVIGKYDFLNSEDRAARAVVNLIEIKFRDSDKEDAFSRMFESEFKDLIESLSRTEDKIDDMDQDNPKFDLVKSDGNFVKSIVEIYNEKMKSVKKSYEMIGQLDPSILKELDIDVKKIKKLLSERLSGLKKLFWNETISRMSEVTDRLITKKRREVLEKIQRNGSVDFTEDNIYSVIIWIIKNAASLIDEQLIDVYENLIEKANVKNYKSNQKVFEFDRWRYKSENLYSHIYLDYRLVLERWGGIKKGWNDSVSLAEYTLSNLRDLLTIANNLGFICNTCDDRLPNYDSGKFWSPGRAVEFYAKNSGKEILLMDVKAFLNGNVHIRMNQKFILALNVEFGRLKGWLHSGREAAEELNDESAFEFFKSNFNALSFNPKIMITANPEKQICVCGHDRQVHNLHYIPGRKGEPCDLCPSGKCMNYSEIGEPD